MKTRNLIATDLVDQALTHHTASTIPYRADDCYACTDGVFPLIRVEDDCHHHADPYPTCVTCFDRGVIWNDVTPAKWPCPTFEALTKAREELTGGEPAE